MANLIPVDHDPFDERAAFGVGSPAEASTQPSGLASLLGGAYNSLGNLAKRAIGNSQNALDTGNYDPAPVVESAMLPMGTGAIAGVPVKAGEAVLGAGPIRAYHGSPHDFDKFDLKKIGTGEGAQAYGHGLYFAENEGVARAYRDALAGKSMRMADGTPIDPNTSVDILRNSLLKAQPDFGQPTQAAQWIFNRLHAGKPVSEIERDISGMAWDETQKSAARSALNAASGWKTDPKMYEVNINADPAHFLDWDKPLLNQSQLVRDAAASHFGKKTDSYMTPDEGRVFLGVGTEGNMRGNDLYRRMTEEAIRSGAAMPAKVKQQQVTQSLNEAGIPGIKYLDQGSRGAGQGSSNYVVFNDKLIEIVRKYAAAGIALPPAIAAEYAQRFKPVDHDPFAEMANAP